MLTQCGIMTGRRGRYESMKAAKPGERPQQEGKIVRRELCNRPSVYFSFDYEGYRITTR
jgi:hypothetical protein